MKDGLLKVSSKRILFSTAMLSAFWAGYPSAAFATDRDEAVTVMQSGTISGVVVDVNGDPIIGASVLLKGTSNGMITDLDGNFTLQNASTGILVVSFVGYKTQEIDLAGKTTLRIVLEEDSEMLDEVVVMAYNSTVKRKVIASVTNVDMSAVENMSGYKDMGNALQGRVPGVIITNSSGGPDSSPSISIRGGGEPMYVIDGIVQDKSAFMRLASQDIESLSVMKDAASSAVYGASAANGIIVVTTKKGSAGKMKVNYTFDGQYDSPLVQRDKLNSIQYAELANSIADYMGSTQPYSDIVLAKIRSGMFNDYPNTDWWDLLVKNGSFSHRHTLTLDGGSEDTQYRMSFMLYDQGSLQKHVAGANSPLDYKTYSFDLNLQHHFRKAGVKLGLDIRPYIVDNKSYGNGSVWNNSTGVQQLNPLDKVYNADGTYAANSPMALYADTDGSYNKDFNFGTDINLNLDWDIRWVKGLKGVFWGNFRLGSSRSKDWTRYVPTYNEDGTQVETADPQLTTTQGYSWIYEFNAGLRYDNTFGDHNLSLGLFYNQRENYSETVTATRINYYMDVDQLFAGPSEGQTNGGSASEGGRLGYVGTLNYDYAGRYLLSASFRYDGNDGFAEGSRWGFFPSVALGYMISDEPFMEKIREAASLDMLKLRGSIGQIGETAARFEYLANWETNQNGAYIGGTLQPTILPASLTSRDLTWYTTTTWNVGLDFGFLRNRLTGTADYFFRRTKGYLVNPIDRYNSTLGNMIGRDGNTYTYGLPMVMSEDAFRRAGAEFSINWKDKIGDFAYSIGANLTFYDELWEKYTQGDDAVTLANPNQRTTHKTIGQGDLIYVYDGLFKDANELLNSPVQTNGTSMMAGDARYVDVNGDGAITSEDMVYDNKPRSAIMQWGIPFSLQYKAWSLSGLFQGSGRQYGMIHNNVKGTGLNKIYYTDQLDIYYPGNEDAVYPRADNDQGLWNGEMNRASSALWRINKTYARLKNLSITYDLKYSLLKHWNWLSTASVSLTGTNLLTICPSLKYGDPETGPINDTATVQTTAYPTTRTVSVTVNLGF